MQDVFGVRESEIEGGWVQSSIEYAIERGICFEKNVRSSDFNFAQTSEILTEIKKLEDYKDAFETFTSSANHYSAQGGSGRAKKKKT